MTRGSDTTLEGQAAPAGSKARVVIAAPVYNKADYFATAIDSLLEQSSSELASLLLVDDASTDGTQQLCEAYAAQDPRVVYRRNPERLGMIGNKRRCFELARELCPGLAYFAWGTDHDVWHPDWLTTMVAALDEHPAAVLAYPKSIRIDEYGTIVRWPWSFDTLGETDLRRRVHRASLGIYAGSMVYGLYRADALERAGVFRNVLNPDRLLMLELAVEGEFVQVPEVLWQRRFTGLATRGRQRSALFSRRAPLYTRLPSWITHTAVFLWRYVVRGAAKPHGRLAGLAVSWNVARLAVADLARRRVSRLRKLVVKRHREAERRRKDRRRERKDAESRARDDKRRRERELTRVR